MEFLPFIRRAGSCQRGFLRHFLPLAVASGCVWFVGQRVSGLDLGDVAEAVWAVKPGEWLVAVVATALSFVAVGQYDALFHTWFGTGVSTRRAATSGAAAIGLAQLLGFGWITGTVVRWRVLPELTPGDALKLTSYVSFSFMAALGFLTSLALAFSGAEITGARTFSLVAAASVVLVPVLSLAGPNILPFRAPPLRLAIRLATLTVIDTGFAALALWALLPAELQLEIVPFYAAFLLALGAGLLSGAPGGVGPFELCLFALLPSLPDTELVASILAFRLVYYAVPGCLALLLLVRPVRPPRMELEDMARPVAGPIRRAEAKLGFQPGHGFITDGMDLLHIAEASQTLIAIGDPASGGKMTPGLLARLREKAGKRALWPVLYKCSARSAALARAAGWAVIPVSEEAWLQPAAFTTAGAPCRQLRRKIRRSRRAGVSIELARLLPISSMSQVARDWAARAGGERGFSMGRFDPEYVASQRCYLAWFKGRLVAFATFHTTGEEWSLDLMRSAAGMPDGTMHALLQHAIGDAADAKIPRVSLAAMPLGSPPLILSFLARRRAAVGLRRFKLSFTPRTHILYAAAPGPAILLIAAVDILLRISFPTCLHWPGGTAPRGDTPAKADAGGQR